MPIDLSNKVYEDTDFSEQDLTHARTFNSVFKRCKFRQFSKANMYSDDQAIRPVNSIFQHCVFDDGDISNSNFYKCDFTGSSFVRTNMYETILVKCNMSYMVFQPRDAFGVAFSFTCQTFSNGTISPFWYLAWFMLANSMTMIKQRGYPEELQARIIDAIGVERYVKLKTLFGREL